MRRGMLLHNLRDSLYPLDGAVEARHEIEGLAAELFKFFKIFNADFVDGFDAVGDKGGADDEQFFGAFFGEIFEYIGCVRFDPRVASKSRLEANGVVGDVELFCKRFCGGVTLRAVAVGVFIVDVVAAAWL